MKKALALVVIGLALGGCAQTHQVWMERVSMMDLRAQKRVAILPISGDMTGAVSDAITTRLMGMGFEVVERSAMASILKEMKLDYSGALDPAQRKSVGAASAADGMIFGSVKTTGDGKIYFMDLRFVDIATGEVLWGMNYINEGLNSPQKSLELISKSMEDTLKRPIKSVKLDAHTLAKPRLDIAQNPFLKAKKYKKLALMRLNGTHYFGEDRAFYGALVTDLIGSDIELVERTQLDSILKEQMNGENGVYTQIPVVQKGVAEAPQGLATSTTAFSVPLTLSKDDLSSISKLTGADALLLGSFQPRIYDPFTFTMANLRVLDLDTGRIAWSATYFNTDMSPENYIFTADWLNVALSPFISSENEEQLRAKYDAVFSGSKSSESSIIERLIPAPSKGINDK